MSTHRQAEILDLRHLGGAQLRPLLEDEARRWNGRLRWDYSRASELLLDYLESRVLPGFVAMHDGKVQGYAFCVYEAAKAVIGDIYAYGEGEQQTNPLCETLLHHLIEMLQATPGVERIESQLLMFPAGALAAPFFARGFAAYPRLFMSTELLDAGELRDSVEMRLPTGLRLIPWHNDFYQAAAELIHRSYRGHVDANVNDQYRTVHGSMRFLHNIVRFPGCGVFTPANSWALRDEYTGTLHGLVLSSQVRKDMGHITQLCVSPALHQQGLGRALLHRCLAEFARHGFAGVSLTVTEENHTARKLYEKYGFGVMHRFDAMVWDGTGVGD